ncbi:hypothetical protein L2E82_24376 [Cichorium intybus]|uniref:Uncharacterized protein n=1 Tax=Cichorium intybus TaxID=13427 RepID=A0ACB9E0Y4_CICIN|nr:hypothetical protein L2E82_24376 [Cichorium intybus]
MTRMRRGSRKLWWFIPCIHRKRLRTESRLDVEVILHTELVTIEEEPETDDPNNGGKQRKGVNMSNKTKEEQMGRVFTTQFSVKNSYALFLDRMTSSRSFGGLQAY